MEAIEQFRKALLRRNILPPTNIIADGKIHRCDADGNNGKNDASYLLHVSGIPAGGFQNWQDGLGWESWRGDIDRLLSTDEQQVQHARVEAARCEREAEDLQRHAAARVTAEKLWAAGNVVSETHPYVWRKQLRAAPGVKLYRGELVIAGLRCDQALMVPLRDSNGALQTLQFIAPDGEKRFLPGGQKRGSYFYFGDSRAEIVCIAEGYATGVSIYQCSQVCDDYMVVAIVVAGDAGNLGPVAQAIRARYPGLRLVICSDDDYRTDGNPGLVRAIAAARIVGAEIAVPDFGAERPDGATDFNDLYRHHGPNAIATIVHGRLKSPDDIALSFAVAKAASDTTSEAVWPSLEELRATSSSTLRACEAAQSTEPTPPTALPSRFKLKTVPEVLQEPSPRWLTQGLIQEESLTVIYGSANTGKSFFALDIALAIARDIIWFGRKTQGGVVVYLAIEGHQRNRLAAYVKHHNQLTLPTEFRVVDVAINLRDRQSNGPTRRNVQTDTEHVVEQIRAQLGAVPIKMIVIDTLNQALQGGDENTSIDMGAFIANANMIRDALRCAVVVVHHAGKDNQRGARGHSSLKGAVDTEIEVIYDKTSGIRTATVTKQRDGRDDVQIHFMLQPVALGPDPDDPNEQITSCVVVPLPLTLPVPIRGTTAPTGRNQKVVWQKFRDLMTSASITVSYGRNGVLEDQLVNAASSAMPIKPGQRDQRKQQAREAIEGMRKAGWVETFENSVGRYMVPGPRMSNKVFRPDLDATKLSATDQASPIVPGDFLSNLALRGESR